jgi:hypothetical protein
MAANDAPPPVGAPLWRPNEKRSVLTEFAIAYDLLVEANYPPDDIWEMTPRQMNAALHFAGKRRRLRQAERLSLHALAAQGDGKEIEKQIKRLAPLGK